MLLKELFILEYLGLPGRVDCIGEYEGELAVIDFKTSEKIKPEKWLRTTLSKKHFMRVHTMR